MYKLIIASLLATAEPDVVKISEALGHLIGKSLEEFGLELDLEAIVKGMKEESEGKEAPMNADACADAIEHLQDHKISIYTETALQREDAVANDILSE